MVALAVIDCVLDAPEPPVGIVTRWVAAIALVKPVALVVDKVVGPAVFSGFSVTRPPGQPLRRLVRARHLAGVDLWWRPGAPALV